MRFDSRQFAQNVYEIVRLVPPGRVTTYGAIARALVEPGRSRLVGWALNNCPADVPAHRVVNRNGVLTGRQFFGGDRMQMLLKEEGVEVIDNKVHNFKQFLWEPMKDMKCDE